MKKTLLSIMVMFMAIGFTSAQERYLDEIFTDVTVTPNVVFGENYYFIPDPTQPYIADLPMDMYEATGDAGTGRACVVVMHTGNFLPKYFNGSPSGNNKDSSIVESCNLFAKRGYVAVAPNYRAGWDPLNADAEVRRSTLINAVYRGINDIKTCVRYLKKEAANLGIDPNKIILYGQGSGGYMSLAYVSLDRQAEFEIEKFTFAGGASFVDTSLVGNVQGFGGTLNVDNHTGFTSDVMFAVNAGGALGDSSWIEPGEPPICSFHCPDDPFAPFEHGIVIVPTTNENVVPVSGSKWVIAEANLNGNNDVIRNMTFTDPYSTAAYTALASSHSALGLNPADYEGLFPFIRAVPVPGGGGAIFPEASPW
ncbi:MAG: alpha/beta hydrolase, partial [Flavobacteriales bacterium]|nr:alpha/beta hydrolase [Flavobacteriales bacterium]